MLEGMVVGDLLGPASGPDEELTERNVRDRYLVGVLALRSQPQPVPVKPEEEDDEETPLLPDELSEGGADTVDDGTTDKDVPIVQARLPSSFGLTFCVKRIWKRYQRSGVITLKLDKTAVPPTSLHDDFPNVYVKGQVRKRDHGYHRYPVPRQRPGRRPSQGRVPSVPARTDRLRPRRRADLLQAAHEEGVGEDRPRHQARRRHDGAALPAPRRVRRGPRGQRPRRSLDSRTRPGGAPQDRCDSPA
jgi:hypothetical protein